MSNASFRKSLKSGGAIGTDKLENILSVYKDLNPTWLLTGKGPILKDPSNVPKEIQGKDTGEQCAFCREKEKVISAQNRTIDILERELSRCQDQLDDIKNARTGSGQKRKAG